ncbi:MAG: hypothetical protein ACAI44_20000 [Candidatus Sericytochromatia bacterium]
MDEIEADLASFSHPTGTLLVSRTRFLGQQLQTIGGNIECCQFRVTQVRNMGTYSGTWQSLVTVYGSHFRLSFFGDEPGLIRL